MFITVYAMEIAHQNRVTYGAVSQNTSHCNFQLLAKISFQIYNFISNITNQNDDIW